MDNPTQFKDLPEFLAKHNAKSEKREGIIIKPTHTRIPDEDLKVYGAAYIIPREDLPQFYKLYAEHIFEKNRMEYLTERQLETNSPILLDLDFRYRYRCRLFISNILQIDSLIIVRFRFRFIELHLDLDFNLDFSLEFN